MIGLARPAMSITGSGAHGIIATMPLLAAARVNGYSEEQLLRAAALSYLVCMYIKEYSGKLSAFCGCAIAAGTGMACGLVLLRADLLKRWNKPSIICRKHYRHDLRRRKPGLRHEGVVAVDAAYRSVNMAMNGIHVDRVHGINGDTPEETMKNMA